MNRILFIFLMLVLFQKTEGQNIFPQKVERCSLSEFCLDCGDTKAIYDQSSFSKVLENINSKYNFKGGNGLIGFQVLVNAKGTGCVLSHTDESNSQLTKDLIKELNSCQWKAAIEENKPVNSSITVIMKIEQGKLIGFIDRINIDEMNENMSNPGEPEVYNKNYRYKNSFLATYEITVWQKENSELPNNMSQICVVDQSNNVWYGSYNGLAMFDGENIIRLNEKNSPFTSKESVRAIAVDKDNNKWIFSDKRLFKYNDRNWESFDLGGIVINDVFAITSNNYGETFICSDTGLIIIKDQKIDFVNSDSVKDLPSNYIMYAFRDTHSRLWIGTFEGTVMITHEKKVVGFINTMTPLSKATITDAVEDEAGNIYFALYAYNSKGPRNKIEEGLAVYTNNGEWKHYNDENSGLPANHINSLFYDKFERVLWIGTNEAGLVRFDLLKEWENYHNKNSKVPSSYIFQITQDARGYLYVATFNGMMRIKKK